MESQHVSYWELFTGIIRVNKGKSSKETEKSQGVPNKLAADAQ